MALSVAFVPPFFLSVMGPVAVCTFGLAFLSPHVVTMSMAPFPHIAGSASALTGFLQMSAGFAGGVAAASIGDPLTAFGIEMIAGTPEQVADCDKSYTGQYLKPLLARG